MTDCETCGNEFPGDQPRCPYCGTHRQFRADNRAKPSASRRVSLKDGLPTVEQALTKLRRELEAARLSGTKTVKFVHGYGSGGRGGAIRAAVRRVLVGEQQHGRIRNWIAGEDVVQRGDELTAVLDQLPRLRNDVDTRRPNEGITWVLM